MKRLFNIRSLVIFALSLIMGGYFYNFIFSSVVWLSVFVLLTIAIISSIIYFIIKHNKQVIKILVCFVLIPIVIGMGFVGVKQKSIYSQNISDGYYYIKGRVDVIYNNVNGDVETLKLSSVELGTTMSSFEEINGNVIVDPGYTMSLDDVFVGDTIIVGGNFNCYFAKEQSLGEKLKKTSKGNCGKLSHYGMYTIIRGDGIKYDLSKVVKSKLFNNMDADAASVAYAMIFGDKSTIDVLHQDNFSASGLAHILAVSGLHVGFIATLFGFLVGLIIKNKYAKTIIMSIVLIFYCYLCNFSASVVRASVMYIIMLIAIMKGEQYDGLTALSFSACVNLILNPLCIFTTGFMLSYGVVFSIFALGTPLKIWLSKIMPLNMASTLSVSLAAWIGSMPLLIYLFGEISFFSIVVNILMVPFVGIVFMAMFSVLMLSWIPGVNVLFVVPELLYKTLNFVVDGVASFKYATLSVVGSMTTIIFMFIALLLASDYIFHKHKYIASSFFVLASAITIFISMAV